MKWRLLEKISGNIKIYLLMKNYKNILKIAENYKNTYAASQEFLKLKNDPKASLWISKQMAGKNDAKEFAVFDQKLRKIYKDMGFQDSYIESPETQKLIKFILESYNSFFKYKNISSYDVYVNIEDILETENYPIFLLMHDLIHQVFSATFVNDLQNERDRDENGLYPSLLNEINEDLASYLSNIAFNNPNQGIFRYIKVNLKKYLSELNNKNIPKDEEQAHYNLSKAIELTFHQAKAELRNKTKKFQDIENNSIDKSKKQLIDGFLSKIKHSLLQQVDNFSLAEIKNFDVNSFYFEDFIEDYYDKIEKSQIINQTDGAALTAWMRGCLEQMKKLVDYFENYFFEDEEEEDY